MEQHGEPRFRFNSGQHTTIPFELTKNGLFFQVRINDAMSPLWFTLDSGAGATYIDQDIARAMGMLFARTKQVQGAGTGKVEVHIINDASFELPGLSTWNHQIHAADLTGLNDQWGRPVEGFFGYDFLERFVVKIDYLSRLLSVSDPAEYVYEGRGAVLPLEFQGHLPYVRAKIEVHRNPPEDSLFLVDSGSQDAVDHPLIAKARGTRPVAAGIGLGNSTHGVFGRVEKLLLGPYELHDLPGVAGTGLGSQLIGGQVLSRFTVTFDYTRKRMILEPRGRMQPEALE